MIGEILTTKLGNDILKLQRKLGKGGRFYE